MNTIYDGTFVIGDTIATDFSAGKGISITEPVGGTLLISNDDTLLYSGTAGYNTEISLSEPTSAFDTVKIYWAGENGADSTIDCVSEFSVHGTKDIPCNGLWQKYSNGKWCFGGFILSANTTLDKYKMISNYRYNQSGNSLIDFNVNQSNFGYVHKVVGSNRKEV